MGASAVALPFPHRFLIRSGTMSKNKRRLGSFEAMFLMVMVALVNTGSIPEVAVTLVDNITIVSTLISTIQVISKVGMRNFHVHANTQNQYCPSINLDKLWSLVSEQTRVKYEKNDKKAPVIDISRAGYF